MKDFDPAKSFGRTIAEGDPHRLRGDEDDTVAFLRELANGGSPGGGPALELAIGTGRIARPLAATGVRVEGIDISQPMVDVLRQQPGGADIPVTMGNYRDVPVDGEYRLIYIVYNTIHNLLTQDDQVQCFINVAKHLTADGVFVVEAIPHRELNLAANQYVHAESVELKSVTLDVARYDPTTQILDESHVLISKDGARLFPIVTRHIWPSEMDLMARIAGLRLKARYGNWRKEPYDANSRNIISVYAK